MHAFDTVKGSDYLGDQDSIEIFTREAPGDIYQLEHWGAVFSRTEDGRLAQRPFGAAGSPRTVFAADITGHVLIQVLYEQVVKRDITVYEEYFAWKLVDRRRPLPGRDLLGPAERRPQDARRQDGRSSRPAARAASTAATTNAYACTGDGMAMALRAGLPLKDMEFMQFHPTTMYPSGILITEGCRGEGGVLRNADGERFMKRLRAERDGARVPRRRLPLRADRDRRGARRQRLRAARPDATSARSGSSTRLPGSRELAMVYAGVDPIYEPIPVRPGAHYHMGGVETDSDGQTELDRPLRGRRGRVRLGARRQPARRQLADGDDHVRPPRRRAHAADWALAHTTVDVPDARRARRRARAQEAARPQRAASGRGRSATSSAVTMLENFGVFRAEGKMSAPERDLDGLRERYRGVFVEDKGDVFNSDLTQAIELGYLLDAGRLHAAGAGSRARRAAVRTRARTTIPSATTRTSSSTRITRWGRRRARAHGTSDDAE